MNKIPFKNHDIDNPEHLFGRKVELEILLDHAERLDQLELIGARRFGKTCILRTLTNLLMSSEESNAFPIYLDLASHGIKGTINVYRYLLAMIISGMYDKWLKDSILTIGSLTVIPYKSWRKVFKQLEEIEDITTITDAFEEFVIEYSQLIEQTFLLLFDEYEYMASEAFDRIEGFMLIRQLSNRADCPISFWLCGASPWRKFVKGHKSFVGGSGEFNGVTIQRYIRPLDESSFYLMWNYECSLISDEVKRKQIERFSKDAFISTGGVPFYAKAIGSKLCVDLEYPDYTCLQNQFTELEKLFSKDEIRLLQDIQKSPKLYKEPLPSSVKNLSKYGIIKKGTNNKYILPIKFYVDYLRAHLYDIVIAGQNQMPSVGYLVDKIAELIYTINENRKRQQGKFMFDPSNDMAIQLNYLRTPCTDRGKFSNFIDVIYIIYWEGSKINSTAGAKLPIRFQDSMFRKAIDRLRHTFGNAHQTDKLIKTSNQIDKGEALQEITGYQYEPQNTNDWLNLQDCILNRFIKELEEISRFIIANP